MPASSADGGHPPGLLEPSMGRTLRGGEKDIEHDDGSLEDDNEAHEIADHCTSEMSEALWKLSSLGAEESLTASNLAIASSSMTLDL